MILVGDEHSLVEYDCVRVLREVGLAVPHLQSVVELQSVGGLWVALKETGAGLPLGILMVPPVCFDMALQLFLRPRLRIPARVPAVAEVSDVLGNYFTLTPAATAATDPDLPTSKRSDSRGQRGYQHRRRNESESSVHVSPMS